MHEIIKKLTRKTYTATCKNGVIKGTRNMKRRASGNIHEKSIEGRKKWPRTKVSNLLVDLVRNK